MRVVIESPLKSETYWGMQRNIHYARQCLRDSILSGEFPFASHLLYPQVLDDSLQQERDQGIAGQLAWINVCDLVAVYQDFGVSFGMQAAIDYAKSIDKPVVFRTIRGVE